MLNITSVDVMCSQYNMKEDNIEELANDKIGYVFTLVINMLTIMQHGDIPNNFIQHTNSLLAYTTNDECYVITLVMKLVVISVTQHRPHNRVLGDILICVALNNIHDVVKNMGHNHTFSHKIHWTLQYFTRFVLHIFPSCLDRVVMECVILSFSGTQHNKCASLRFAAMLV